MCHDMTLWEIKVTTEANISPNNFEKDEQINITKIMTFIVMLFGENVISPHKKFL